MSRPRVRSWLLVFAVLVLLVSQRVWAIAPTVIMIYGEGLQTPIFVRPGPDDRSYTFMWAPFSRTSAGNAPSPSDLEGRRYVSYAVFWGPQDIERLPAFKPDDASQHGRIYFPTASSRATVVMTTPLMTVPNQTAPPGIPVPRELSDFTAGRTLDGWDVSTVKALRIPGM